MNAKSHGRKSSRRTVSKRLYPEKAHTSVTVTPPLAKTVSKRYEAKPRSPVGKVGPREQAARLAQWFAIANETAKLPIRLKGTTGATIVLTSGFFEPVQQSVRESFNRFAAYTEERRTEDPDLLERYRAAGAKKVPAPHIVWKAEGGEFWGDFSQTLDGYLMENPDNPRALFLEALRGAELARFKRCPICKQFFYALRAKTDSATDSKACSLACNDALRVRRWRDNQAHHEYNRKLKLSGIKPLRTDQRSVNSERLQTRRV
jgi:hypothetical protein